MRKLTTNFLDEKTKSSLSNEFKNLNGKINEIKKIFSIEFLKKRQKYKEEDDCWQTKKGINDYFFNNQPQKDISTINIIGIILGHIIFWCCYDSIDRLDMAERFNAKRFNKVIMYN